MKLLIIWCSLYDRLLNYVFTQSRWADKGPERQRNQQYLSRETRELHTSIHKWLIIWQNRFEWSLYFISNLWTASIRMHHTRHLSLHHVMFFLMTLLLLELVSEYATESLRDGENWTGRQARHEQRRRLPAINWAACMLAGRRVISFARYVTPRTSVDVFRTGVSPHGRCVYDVAGYNRTASK